MSSYKVIYEGWHRHLTEASYDFKPGSPTNDIPREIIKRIEQNVIDWGTQSGVDNLDTAKPEDLIYMKRLSLAPEDMPPQWLYFFNSEDPQKTPIPVGSEEFIDLFTAGGLQMLTGNEAFGRPPSAIELELGNLWVKTVIGAAEQQLGREIDIPMAVKAIPELEYPDLGISDEEQLSQIDLGDFDLDTLGLEEPEPETAPVPAEMAPDVEPEADSDRRKLSPDEVAARKAQADASKAASDEPDDQDKIIAGINSKRYPDSLRNMLEPLKSFLSKDERGRLQLLMLKAAEEDDIVLEAIGGPDREPRTFSPNTTRDLNDLVMSFDLDSKDQQKLEKTIKMWAKLNTVKFSAPPKDPDTDIELPPEAPVSIDNEPQPEPSASHKASLQKLHGYQEDEIEALEWWGKLPEPQKDELASGGRDTVVDAWRAQKDDTPGEEEESDSEISVDKAECDELFDMEDPAIQKLLDQVQATNTIRGKVAEIGRDFSFAMDAVTLSILGVSLAAPPAAAAAPFTAGAARVGSAVAVAADLLNGEWKQAAMDSFGLIPFGGAAGKTGKTAATKTTEKLAAQAAAKAGKEAAAEAAAQGAKKAAIETAAKAASKSAKAVVQTIQKAGAAVTGGIAKAEGAIAGKLVKMGVEEGLSQTLAKTIIHSSKMKLQHKIDSMLGDAPQPSAYETDEEYKGALRKYYDERKATSAQVYASCFADTDSEITKSVKGFLDEIHDWVDELPRWLGTAIEWGMDTYDSFTGKDEPEEAVAEDWGEYAGREVVQEQLDRWQTLAGINKRIL